MPVVALGVGPGKEQNFIVSDDEDNPIRETTEEHPPDAVGTMPNPVEGADSREETGWIGELHGQSLHPSLIVVVLFVPGSRFRISVATSGTGIEPVAHWPKRAISFASTSSHGMAASGFWR